MKSSSLAIALVATLGLGSAASANPLSSIGVQFRGGQDQNGGGVNSSSLAPTQVAGVPGVAQSHYNVMTGYNFTNNVAVGFTNPSVLVESNGVHTTATITATGGGTYGNGAGVPDSPSGLADEILNSGLLNGRSLGTNTVTVNNIPFDYAKYDLYVYTSNDVPRGESITVTSVVGSPTYYVNSPGANGGTGYVDHNSSTSYTYLQGTSTNPASPTNNADYVVFTGLSGSSLTFTTSNGGNPFLNGFQIVQTQSVPEPSSFALAGLALAGLAGYGWKRRRNCG